MRYIIETEDEQGTIGSQIAKWSKEKKVDIIEKGQPVIEIKAHLEKVAKALEVLKKAGYNSYVMRLFIYQETKVSHRDVDAVLESQESFFRQIGVLK